MRVCVCVLGSCAVLRGYDRPWMCWQDGGEVKACTHANERQVSGWMVWVMMIVHGERARATRDGGAVQVVAEGRGKCSC